MTGAPLDEAMMEFDLGILQEAQVPPKAEPVRRTPPRADEGPPDRVGPQPAPEPDPETGLTPPPDMGGEDGPDALAPGEPGEGEAAPEDGALPLDAEPQVEPLEAVQARLRRDRLYDNAEELEAQCRELFTAADTVSERGKDEAAKKAAREVRDAMEEAERQLTMLRRNLSSFGDEPAGKVLDTVRERLDSGHARLKHVIDADESFSADAFGNQIARPEGD